ncbi:VOC family protein [Rubinisphaera margarita]|uniref:VOC family protein n=1 Tax=Rubinisphaera margarita TaxID=2909586 RepID=UPI001EE90BE9|nr:VOC family protein [Rubinisphaera margarita]MCG6154287.1 VOC family protein [Rubinisphaera margarita]
MQLITPFLWYNTEAEEAARFYTSIFPDSKILSTSYYGSNTHMPEGTVMTVNFELAGQKFVAMNGGPNYPLTPAISFMVEVDSQEELDRYWDALSAGGEPVQCGWLTDKFGLSWQITPPELLQMIEDPDSARKERAMGAMMQMVKLDLNKLREAYNA